AVIPENLQATGVTDPLSCGISANLAYRIAIGCGSSTVSYRAMAELGHADSVRWSFPGGTPTTSTSDAAEVIYATSGTYNVQLLVYGAGTVSTFFTSIEVNVPDPSANGLAAMDTYPFTQGFEPGFSLPHPNMHAVYNGYATWQVFPFAGYASDHCLYVPAEFNAQGDTIDLVLGNFNFNLLAQPTLRFKVAASMHALANWSRMELWFHDQCSSIFMGNPWAIWQLYDMGSDMGPNYVPSDDAQWRELNYTYWVWNQASGGEITLRLIRNPMGPGTVPEAIYIDDLYVGELPLVTGVADRAADDALSLSPNPNTGAFVLNTREAGRLTITDALGQVVRDQRVQAGRTTIVHALPAGVYTVRVGT
ncbi:MAG TPA: T9SS type A sorting domain-containing protein, partial [Flavobacteriales bacterium]|nr:T9SS type A sorting domain-containing protein [Flavobacteriales bacterium]